MASRATRMLILGVFLGGLAAMLVVGGTAAAWGWRAGAAARGHDVIMVPVQPAQAPLNPKEFIPIPNNGNDRGPGPQTPTPGAGNQNCDKILYFYQGRLYQLRPGPMPRNGGNPEFYFMQPYEGPSIPGFPTPGPMGPDTQPGQQLPGHI